MQEMNQAIADLGDECTDADAIMCDTTLHRAHVLAIAEQAAKTIAAIIAYTRNIDD